MFQAPFNTMEYSIVGDDISKEYFIINEITGEISVKKNLGLDPDRRTSYVIQVDATDKGNPTQTSLDSARVTVRVLRNYKAPQFGGELPYTTTVNEKMSALLGGPREIVKRSPDCCIRECSRRSTTENLYVQLPLQIMMMHVYHCK